LPGQITQPPYEQKAFVPSKPKTPGFEVHQDKRAPKINKPIPIRTPADAYAVATAPPQAAAKPSRLVIELRTPGALQKAILLREILGPPRALQPLEL
jgi:hypothetical protein